MQNEVVVKEKRERERQREREKGKEKGRYKHLKIQHVIVIFEVIKSHM